MSALSFNDKINRIAEIYRSAAAVAAKQLSTALSNDECKVSVEEVITMLMAGPSYVAVKAKGKSKKDKSSSKASSVAENDDEPKGKKVVKKVVAKQKTLISDKTVEAIANEAEDEPAPAPEPTPTEEEEPVDPPAEEEPEELTEDEDDVADV